MGLIALRFCSPLPISGVTDADSFVLTVSLSTRKLLSPPQTLTFFPLFKAACIPAFDLLRLFF